MKHFIVIGTLIALCFAQFAPSLVLFHFEINQAKIAAEKCVERNVPNSCCQGKCYLNDSLEKTASPKEEHQELPSWVQWEWILSAAPQFHFDKILFKKEHPKICGLALLPGVQTRIEFPPEVYS